MRKLLTISATLLLLSGCNTIDGFGEDLGAVGDAFGGMFDGTMRNSQARRDAGSYGGYPPPSQMGGGYGGAPMQGGGGYDGSGYGGAGYGGGNMGAMPPQFPPYYQQQPRQPAMPYYYNEGY